MDLCRAENLKEETGELKIKRWACKLMATPRHNQRSSTERRDLSVCTQVPVCVGARGACVWRSKVSSQGRCPRPTHFVLLRFYFFLLCLCGSGGGGRTSAQAPAEAKVPALQLELQVSRPTG